MAKKKSKVPKSKAKAKPRQERLPGMKDAKLEALHEAALSYAEIRDQRQQLTTEEVELKGRLLTLMHKFKKDHYEYNGVTVDLVSEQETVKVRVRKQKADEDVDVQVSSPENEEVEVVDDVEEEEPDFDEEEPIEEAASA